LIDTGEVHCDWKGM